MSTEEDVKGGDEAGDHYKQAALLVEFLRESKFAKERFPAFVSANGRVPDNDVAAIEAPRRTAAIPPTIYTKPECETPRGPDLGAGSRPRSLGGRVQRKRGIPARAGNAGRGPAS
jgi:hypothetical protein